MRKFNGLVLSSIGVLLVGILGFHLLGKLSLRKAPNTAADTGNISHNIKKAPPANIFAPPSIKPYSGPMLRADQITRYQGSASLQPKIKTNVDNEQGMDESLRKGAFSTELYSDPELGRQVRVVAHELLVRFDKDCSTEDRDSLLAKYGATLIQDAVSPLSKLGYVRIRMSDGALLEKAVQEMGGNPIIAHVEPNAVVRSFGEEAESLLLNDQWGLQAIRAPEAWRQTQGDPDIIIAVIDSGIDTDHPNLANCIIGGVNLIADGLPPEDDFGHGTQVAGIIAANPVEGLEITGIAPKCKVMPFKVIDAVGQGSCADVAAAIVMATDQNCSVINLSLGTYFHSELLEAALEYATSRDCVVVAASGNDGSIQSCFPAAFNQVLAVGSAGRGGSGSRFSNRADYIDTSAPGENILTTVKGGMIEPVSGTSASASHVSGLAALLLSNNGNLSQNTVRVIIRNSSIDIGESGWDRATGMGLINCEEALSTPYSSDTDLGIVDVLLLPENPLPGQAVSVYATIRNHGDIESEECLLSLKCGETIIAQNTVAAIPPKMVSEVQLSWTLPADLADDIVLLTAEIEAQSHETRLSDNVYQHDLYIASNYVSDVGIIDCSVSGLPAIPGEQLTIDLKLANYGNVEANDLNVVFFFEDGIVASNLVLNLPIGGTVDSSFRWFVPSDEELALSLSRGFKFHILVDGPLGDSKKQNNSTTLRFKLSEGQSKHIFPLHKVGSGQEVHQWIAKESYDFFVAQIEGSSLASYLTRPGLTPNSSWSSLAAATHDYDGDDNVLEGTKDEDELGENPSTVGSDYYLTPYLYHFCAGADDTELDDGLGVWDSAYTIANWYRSNYWSGNNASSYYYLGHFIHLLADMTVPAHTHNDEHPLSEPYEDDVADFGWYDDFTYGGTLGSHAWNLIIARPATTENLFRGTADYTEDYDSEDEAGDWDGPSGQPYANSKHADELYYPVQYHHPDLVDGSGINGMSSDETWNTALDLIPFAIYRTAQAYRYFFYKIDSTGPSVSMTYPSSEDPGSPTMRTSTSAFNLTASASDSVSGYLKEGFQYYWAYWDSSAGWSDWSSVSPSPTDSSVSFTPSQGETLYAFAVLGENGGGLITQSTVKYLRIYSETIDADLSLINLVAGRESSSSRAFTNCSFDVVNNGPGDIYSEFIMVDYYLSDDATFGDADDERIGDTGFTVTIPAGGTLPIDLSGGGLANMYDLWLEGLVDNDDYYLFADVRVSDGAPDDPTSGNDYSRTSTKFSYTGEPPPPTPGTLQFKSSTYSVDENGGNLRIYVSRTGGSDGAASVNYATANGTAHSGADYTAKSGTLSWANGDGSDKYFDVPITDDVVFEYAETFTANLSSASGASMGSPSTTTVTINGPNDQDVDTDEDGFTDMEEAIAGTDPDDSTSYFCITNIGLSSSFVLEWPCLTGRWYEVLWTPALTNSFQSLEDYIDHPQNSYTDTVHNAEPSGFYKVKVRMK